MGTPREDLADKLRKARRDAGYGSHGALARKLTVSRSVVSKAESATHPVPGDPLLVAWAGATGAAAESLLELAHRAKSGTPEWFMPFRQAESDATLLRYWSPIVVPGIAQTTAYMRALFEDEGHLLDQIEELSAARIERQSLIGRVPITMIVSQHVLYRLVRSPVVMAAQCGHLASLADRPNIALHVLPDGVNMGVWGGFALATQGNSATVSLTAIEDIPSTAASLVAKVTLAFERILGAALPRAESLALIRTAEEKWKTQME
jgi:hypothetical protein